MSSPALTRKMRFGRYDYATFLCFCAYAACSVVIPVVLLPLAHSLGFPLEQGGKGLGGALQLGRSIPMVGSMLFCGILAGAFGKVKVLGWAMIFMSIGIALAAGAPGYALLFCAVVISGLGEGVIEGLATPVIQDLHEEEGAGRYINFSHSFWSVGVLGTVLLAGWLLTCGVSWRLILAGVSLLAGAGALFYLLPNRGSKYPDKQEKQNWREVMRRSREVMRVPRFWLFFAAIFMAGGGEFCLTFWVASFIQLDFGASAFWGGVGTGVFALGMIFGRMGWGILISQLYLKQLIVYSAVGGLLVGLAIPFCTGLMPLMVLLFFSGVATAPFWPSIQSYCVERIKGDSTAIFIILSMSGVPGCGFFAWLMGVCGDAFGLKGSFFLVPLCYLLVGGLIGLDWFDTMRCHRKGRV